MFNAQTSWAGRQVALGQRRVALYRGVGDAGGVGCGGDGWTGRRQGGIARLCSCTTGSAAVALTRYIGQTLSGATLSGTITVGSDVPLGCTTCFVRVFQHRPVGGFLEATAPLAIA